jgi:signal transduction histidine kinase
MTASLRKRLVMILLALMLFAWVGSAAITGAYASRVLLDQVDRQLEQYSSLVSYITEIFAIQIDAGNEIPGIGTAAHIEGVGVEPMVIDAPASEGLTPVVNIFLGDQLFAVLENSPRFDVPTTEGFSFRLIDGSVDIHNHWRILSRHDKTNGLWIMVGIELDQARWALLGTFAQALFPLFIILPLTVGLVYFGVSRGLRPLRSLARQIAERSPQQLEAVALNKVPEEMQSTVVALNKLLERLGFALESEQRFTANAAHELMTPLAAIKTEVQLCQRQLSDQPPRVMLQRIAARVDRATHTVEQLLTLARVDPDAPLEMTDVHLRAQLIEALADTAHLAVESGLEIDLVEGVECILKGSEESLGILLRNLLSNAFRYGTPGSAVKINLVSGGQGCELEICNDCATLSPAEFERIDQRFYRVPGSKGLGAGLGLSIVTRIADQHGALFNAHADDGGEGFCARLSFSC